MSDGRRALLIFGPLVLGYLALFIYSQLNPVEGPPPPYPFWHVDIPEPSNPSP